MEAEYAKKMGISDDSGTVLSSGRPSDSDIGQTERTAVISHSDTAMVLFIAGLFSLAAFSIDLYLPSFAAIREGLHAEDGQVQLTLSVFFLGFGFGQLIFGPMADQLGRRQALLIGIGVYVLASVLCAVAPSVELLIVARGLQAVGGCSCSVVGRAIIRDLYKGDQASRVFSFSIMFFTAVPLIAPMFGAYLLESLGWRSNFWFLAILGILYLVLVVVLLKETLPRSQRKSISVKAHIGSYFLLLRQIKIVRYVLSIGLVFAGFSVFLSNSPLLFHDYYHMNPKLYAGCFALIVGGLLLSCFFNAAFVKIFGHRALFAASIKIAAASSGLLILCVLTSNTALPLLVLLISGYAISLQLVAANGMAGLLSASASQAGTVSAVLGFFQFLASAAFSAVVSFAYVGTPVAMATGMAIGGLGSLLAYLLIRPKFEGKKEPDN